MVVEVVKSGTDKFSLHDKSLHGFIVNLKDFVVSEAYANVSVNIQRTSLRSKCCTVQHSITAPCQTDTCFMTYAAFSDNVRVSD